MSTKILELVESPERAGWLARLRRKLTSGPTATDEVETFLVREAPGGSWRLERFTTGPTRTIPPDASVAYVRTKPEPLDCVVPGIVKDENANRWDLVVKGEWEIADPRRFLLEHGLRVASPRVSLSAAAAGSWMGQTLRTFIETALVSEDLRQKDTGWWAKRLGEPAQTFGVAVRVTATDWDSEDLKRAEAEKHRQEDLKRMEEEREREREAELRQQEKQTEYEKEKKRLEADQQISTADRTHELALLEERHRAELLETKRELETAQWAHEQAAIEHELNMARLRNDLKATTEAEEQAAAGEAEHSQAMANLDEADRVLAELPDKAPSVLGDLSAADGRVAHQAAERLTSPEFGVSAGALEALGYTASSQGFIAALRDFGAKSSATLSVGMKTLQTRDIGTARINALPIGSSLQIEFTSTLTGYVTIVNIGTSGKSWLQVPNPFAAPAAARVEAGRPYTVPGPQLLPQDAIGGYFENGPPGWEHIAVVISDSPIVEPHHLELASPGQPFIDLTTEAAGELAAALGEASPDQYAIGILSFLVE